MHTNAIIEMLLKRRFQTFLQLIEYGLSIDMTLVKSEQNCLEW